MLEIIGSEILSPAVAWYGTGFLVFEVFSLLSYLTLKSSPGLYLHQNLALAMIVTACIQHGKYFTWRQVMGLVLSVVASARVSTYFHFLLCEIATLCALSRLVAPTVHHLFSFCFFAIFWIAEFSSAIQRYEVASILVALWALLGIKWIESLCIQKETVVSEGDLVGAGSGVYRSGALGKSSYDVVVLGTNLSTLALAAILALSGQVITLMHDRNLYRYDRLSDPLTDLYHCIYTLIAHCIILSIQSIHPWTESSRVGVGEPPRCSCYDRRYPPTPCASDRSRTIGN
jgi:hypothetical protein